jgi:hypothetical protein
VARPKGVRITIPKDLEERLRVGGDPGPLLEEVIALVDRELGAGKKPEVEKDGTGMGFKELLSWFHFYFGPDFSPPLRPDPSYVVRMVNLAKHKGVTKENVGRICEGARRTRRGPYSIGAVLWRAEEYFHAGGVSAPAHQVAGLSGKPSGVLGQRNVHTGRQYMGGPDGEKEEGEDDGH